MPEDTWTFCRNGCGRFQSKLYTCPECGEQKVMQFDIGWLKKSAGNAANPAPADASRGREYGGRGRGEIGDPRANLEEIPCPPEPSPEQLRERARVAEKI